jgi:5-methylcytosine-specific restriction endonuclease McrA
MTIEEFRDAIVREKWDPATLELAIKTQFKCHYCDLDFLSSVNAYDSIEVEHIVPKDPGSDDASNKTLVCRTCNKMKRRWNPALHVANASDRNTLLSAAKEHVKAKRKEKAQEIERVKALAKQLIVALQTEE